MKIIQLSVGQLQANCFLAVEPNSNQCLIIDPGDDADYIVQAIGATKPKAILATHGHFDHVMAASQLQLRYNISFYIDQKDQFLLDRIVSTARHFLGNIQVPPAPKNVTYFHQVDPNSLPFHLTVIPTPGHTPGSVSLLLKDENILFSGDLLFQGGGFGRTDFSYSSQPELTQSINRILALPPKTIIYTGHGEQTTIASEAKYWQQR